jgi:hypothetical protein
MAWPTIKFNVMCKASMTQFQHVIFSQTDKADLLISFRDLSIEYKGDIKIYQERGCVYINWV